MTVVLLANERRYVGVAGDTKPTTGVPAGSTFYETDTGDTYIYDGSSWTVRPTARLDAGSAIIGKVGIDQTTPGTTDRVTVGGKLVTIAVEVTRPNDANPYLAKDVFDASTSAPAGFVFQNMARVTGGSGYIVKAQLLTDQKTNTARFRLHLFNAAPTYINDNGPYLKLYANVAARVGEIDFPACATEDPTNSTAAGSQLVPGQGNLPLGFVCAADAHLYGILEILDAFTPASQQKITIKLSPDQN